MATLSDAYLKGAIHRGQIRFEPELDPERQIQPASVDLCLGQEFLVPRRWKLPWQDYYKRCMVPVIPDRNGNRQCGWIKPRSFILATTIEKVCVPADLVGVVSGKSSIGRLGLFIENAGFIDPGFEGQITLELFNASGRALPLFPGMRICQMSFNTLTGPARHPYGSSKLGSSYQDQEGVRGSSWVNGSDFDWQRFNDEAAAGIPQFYRCKTVMK